MAVALVSVTVKAAEPASRSKLEFNRSIRPILAENCFACHGPDKAARKGKLRLDQREAAVEKGAFKPGKPEESELIHRIFSSQDDEVMPPPDSKKQLTQQQKELLRTWIQNGAEYQPHWSYIPATRPEVPVLKNQAGGRNAIDAFVRSVLEVKNLSPAAETDESTLLRRLSLDLIGLPPTLEELRDYLADTNPGAYERQVERLLQSPHYGERMAVPWLDLVRFADTVGYHGDQNINVFPYRDYVINAFNGNLPFDQFTIEQLAGDLLPNPTTNQLVATAFNRLNMVTREGGAQPGEYMAKYAADRVRTVSTTWLGSTMGCCECHDHKYDPFSTRDFYSLEAFFADVKQWGVYQDYNYTPNPDLKNWSNDHPFPPELVVESPYLKYRLQLIENRISALAASILTPALETKAALGALFQEWRRLTLEFLETHPDGWATPEPQAGLRDKKAATNTVLQAEIDHSVLIADKATGEPVFTLPLTAGWVAAVRLELLPRPEHDGKLTANGSENTTITLTATLRDSAGKLERTLAFYDAQADQHEDRFVNGYPVIGVQRGWTTAKASANSTQTAVWLLDPPLLAQAGDTLTVHLTKGTPGCVRISVSPLAASNALESGAKPGFHELLRNFVSAARDENAQTVARAFLLGAEVGKEGFASYKKLHEELLGCRDGKSPVVVTEAWKPKTIRVLARGNWQDESGQIVAPATPNFLPTLADSDSRRLTRLDLAHWLVARENPLTARTAMNRLWKQFFGAGLSLVVDDLGAQGEWPTHPELLDWLAVEFMESGWDLKHMVRLIVTSATYRQSSNPRPEIKEMDPANRWLASQSPRRLEAEFVRDNALTIAGLLNRDLGGPSAFPYQPAGYYANLQFPDRDYHADADDRQYRRGVYAHWQRTFLNPSLANFDAPAREECTAIRNVSNSPQQALTLLNDPVYVEAARSLAALLLQATTAEDAERIRLAYERALARIPRPAEVESLKRFLGVQRDYYQAQPEAAGKLLKVGLAPATGTANQAETAAWTQVCRVVLDLHETITRY